MVREKPIVVHGKNYKDQKSKAVLGSETFVSLTKRRLPVRHGDFVKPESFCTCVLKAKYYPNGMLEDTGFTGNASSTWQAIAHGLELLKKGLMWRV
jgi:hypothetical protein